MLGIAHKGNEGGKGKQTHSPKLLCSFTLMPQQSWFLYRRILSQNYF